MTSLALMEWNPTLSELAAQWISEQQTYEKRNENPPAVARLFQMWLDDPHSLWPFILEVASQTKDEKALAMLAAGPLEDLIREHRDEYFDRIEEQYRRSPTFREALSGVWISADNNRLVQLYSKLGCQKIGDDKS